MLATTYSSVMARDESPKALTDEIQKNGSLTYDLHLFSANQKSSHKVLTDSVLIWCFHTHAICDIITNICSCW